MALGCLSRWCWWFLFLVLRKNIENIEKITRNIGKYWKISNIVVIAIFSLLMKKSGNIFPKWPNFSYFQYFFAKPKIKIISIIEINIPVPSKLRSNRPLTRNLISRHFFARKSCWWTFFLRPPHLLRADTEASHSREPTTTGTGGTGAFPQTQKSFKSREFMKMLKFPKNLDNTKKS